MIYNNTKNVKRIKRIFFQGSGIIGIAAFILFLFDFLDYGIIAVGVFGMWFLFFQVADFQYIEFKTEGNKIILRYYKAISFSRPGYNSIDFLHQFLKDFEFENSVFGKLTDLTLIVQTKQGISEFPSVSLLAVSKSDRIKIQDELKLILSKKS